MTNPTVTYGHGYLNDCTTLDGVKAQQNIDPADATAEILYGDVLKLSGKCDTTDNELVSYRYDNDDILSKTYTRFLLRWKTSQATTNGMGAKVLLDFSTDTSDVQYILGEEDEPQFSPLGTPWQVTSGTIDSGKTIKRVIFYADDYPDSYGDGGPFTAYVCYDFLLLHKNTFTFPNVGHGMEFTPPPRYATIPIFGRVGDITQCGGSESATVRCSCDLDIGRLSTTDASCDGSDWKRPQGVDAEYKTDVVRGEVFYDISHNTSSEPWQWLDTGYEQFKATLEQPVFRRGGDGHHILDLLFREYRLSCASNEYYYERFGLNL